MGVDDRDVGRFKEIFSDAWNAVVDENVSLNISQLPIFWRGSLTALEIGRPVSVQPKQAFDIVYLPETKGSATALLLAELGKPIFDFEIAAVERSWEMLSQCAPGLFARAEDVHITVIYDGIKHFPGAQVPLLRDVMGAWVVDYLVLSAEVKGGSFFRKTQKNLSELKRSLNRIRLQLCSKLAVDIGGTEEPLPLSLDGKIVAPDSDFPALLVERKASETSSQLFCRIGELLAHVVNRQLASAFEAAALRLMVILGNEDVQSLNPTDEDIAEALGVTVERVQAARRDAAGDPAHLIFLLRPLVRALGMVDPFGDVAVFQDEFMSEDDVRVHLQPIAEALRFSDQELVDSLLSVNDPRDFLEGPFGISISDLNNALEALGSPYQKVSYKDRHERQFAAYVMENRPAFIEMIREGFIEAFDRGDSLSQYASLGAFETLKPDSDWYETVDELSEQLMQARVVEWFTENGMHFLPVPGKSRLLPVEQIRDINRDRLREFAERVHTLIAVWSTRNRAGLESVEQWWTSHNVKASLLVIAARDGWLDFRRLDDALIVSWLHRSDDWPRGMPASLDMKVLGIGIGDVTEAQSKLKESSDRRRFERSRIVVFGKELSAVESDYYEILDYVRSVATTTKDILSMGASDSLVKFLPLGKRISGAQPVGKGRPDFPKNPDTKLSEEQRSALGLIGEAWAMEWIKARHMAEHGLIVTEEAWVSSYRGKARGVIQSGEPDKLGYDFKVDLKQVSYYYEVKASSGDPEMIELGPTEIAAASRYRRDDKDKFRVLYVANVLNPSAIRFVLLPNPFSRNGEKIFRSVGGGSVKYRFQTSLKS